MGFSRWVVTTFPMSDRAAERYANRIERRYGTNIRETDPSPPPATSPRKRKSRKQPH